MPPTNLDRRQLLAGVAVAVGTAGCGGSGDDGPQLAQLNLRNFSSRRLDGALFVGDPDDELVLQEGFEISVRQTDDPESGLVRYGNVFTTEGTYDISVSLRTPVGGENEADARVEVSDLEATNLVVAFAPEGIDESVAIGTAEEIPGIGGSEE